WLFDETLQRLAHQEAKLRRWLFDETLQRLAHQEAKLRRWLFDETLQSFNGSVAQPGRAHG
ncbi:MAG: hypothetical protein KKG60_03920, partial [Nanoarchaeota archaeon]|nr:hypothetical protein [Nanoarchaeota archaeon]